MRIIGNIWLAFVFAVTVAHAGDWPQFLGPDRNGSYRGVELNTAWFKDGPPVVWKNKVGEGFSGPVVVTNRVVIFQRAGDKESVEALDAQNGKEVWKFDYPCTYRDDFSRGDGPRATPAIKEGRVFTFGADGMLHCLDFGTGKKIWLVDTKKEFAPAKGFFGVACSPLVYGDKVLLNIGGAKGAGIVAFQASDGKVAWKATDDEASYSSPTVANVHGKPTAFFLTRNFLIALDPENGRVAFQFPWQPSIHASVSAATPLVVDDLIFISASYGAGAAALKITDKGPEKLWSGDDILSNHYATSVHHQGYLYGFDGRQEQGCNLRCVELKTGKIRWSQDHFGAGTVTLAGNELLILTEKGELIFAPASSEAFKPKARAQILPFNVRAYPAIADGFLYARGPDTLICVDMRKRP